MKKFVIIAGMVAMAGALFLASPASAQDNEAITAVLNDDGSVTVTGTGWEGAPTLYVTICKGADPAAENGGITAGNATQVCQDIMTDGFSTNPERGDGGTTTYTIPADKVGEVPEEGYVILQGEFASGSDWSATTVLTAGGAAEEPAAEEPAEEEPEAVEDPAEEEPEAEGAGGDDEMDGDDENIVDTEGSEEEGMETPEDMNEEEAMETDSMANTGSESGLLAVIGVSILLAGLFAVGLGRRFAKRS